MNGKGRSDENKMIKSKRGVEKYFYLQGKNKERTIWGGGERTPANMSYYKKRYKQVDKKYDMNVEVKGY